MSVAEHKLRTRESPPLDGRRCTIGSTTVDHKKIGILYVLMSLVFLVVGGAGGAC